uniref:Uncharacterized protein n=1 Tax=Setaria italica TaxID=4555 RepID=K3YXA8_SETIT
MLRVGSSWAEPLGALENLRRGLIGGGETCGHACRRSLRLADNYGGDVLLRRPALDGAAVGDGDGGGGGDEEDADAETHG